MKLLPARDKVVITPDALWIMLLSTIRYAMGRRTYITALCADYATRYGRYLTEEQRMQIVNDIKDEFAAGRDMGDSCDRTEWERAIEALGGKP